jgi:CheY-like chemotaxis protein
MHGDKQETPTTHGLTDLSAGHDWRLGRFPNLMLRRIEEILLVSSAYESFILEEDGLLTELIFSEYTDLGLTHAPHVARAGSREEALAAIRDGDFDLVITMLGGSGAETTRFVQAVRQAKPDLPVVLLISNELELIRLGDRVPEIDVDGVYVWQGDPKLFLAIIKLIEDRWNAEHDTRIGGVGVIILVEDSIRYRSSLLPALYSELVEQTRSVMQDGLNRMHKLLRMRARPKILAAATYEDGMKLFERFRDYLFGVIADVGFPRAGQHDAQAGLAFTRHVKSGCPDLPVLLQSSDPHNRKLAESVQCAFLHKHSRTLLEDLREFMLNNFGFGDFVFRLPDGHEIARAPDLLTMKQVLPHVPGESLDYHGQRNHFSNWLRARTEFVVARRLRPRKRSEFPDSEAVRRYLISALEDALGQNRRGVIEDFSRRRFDASTRFARIGGGSLGGKARGLAFFDALLARHKLDKSFDGVHIYVPRSVVIGTEIFDEFLQRNKLRRTKLYSAGDDWIRKAFRKAKLPPTLVEDLRVFLGRARYPIAVRSSSLLEDSQFHPFAGVYDTYMLANNHADENERLKQLCAAIKLVYASTFFAAARRYLEATPYRIEEQKMGVVLQQLVGSQHEHYFYPSFAGVVCSYNFYPFGHMKPEEGVASVVLGLGQLVVEGGDALHFCPAHPHVLPQLAHGKQFLDQSQRGFFAIDLRPTRQPAAEAISSTVVRLDLEAAERHGTLGAVGSVWSHENRAFYDGISRPGVRAVTFAHVLKADLFPLAKILRRILDLGQQSMGVPVEIEFAVNLESRPKELAILQMRPHATSCEFEPVEIRSLPREVLLCYSTQALGNGVIDGIQDVVYVKPDAFDAAKTREIAREVSTANQTLRAAERAYMLIGPGRWGSSNHWLGIPVGWGHVSAARVLVEAGLEDFVVDPSQGSHFFHNLVSAGTAYLTVNPQSRGSFIDWQWLDSQPVENEAQFVRHVRLPTPVEARIDGRASEGAVLKRSTRAVPNE